MNTYLKYVSLATLMVVAVLCLGIFSFASIANGQATIQKCDPGTTFQFNAITGGGFCKIICKDDEKWTGGNDGSNQKCVPKEDFSLEDRKATEDPCAKQGLVQKTNPHTGKSDCYPACPDGSFRLFHPSTGGSECIGDGAEQEPEQTPEPEQEPEAEPACPEGQVASQNASGAPICTGPEDNDDTPQIQQTNQNPQNNNQQECPAGQVASQNASGATICIAPENNNDDTPQIQQTNQNPQDNNQQECPEGFVSAISYDANGVPHNTCEAPTDNIPEEQTPEANQNDSCEDRGLVFMTDPYTGGSNCYEPCPEGQARQFDPKASGSSGCYPLQGGQTAHVEEPCPAASVYVYNASGAFECAESCPAGQIIRVETVAGEERQVCTVPQNACGPGQVIQLAQAQSTQIIAGEANCQDEEDACAAGETLVRNASGIEECVSNNQPCPEGMVRFEWNGKDGQRHYTCEDPVQGEDRCEDGQQFGPTNIQQAASRQTYSCADEEELCPAGTSALYNASGALLDCVANNQGCPAGTIRFEWLGKDGRTHHTCEEPDNAEDACGDGEYLGPTRIQQAAQAPTYNCADEEELCPAGTTALYNASGMVLECLSNEEDCPAGLIRFEWEGKDGLLHYECIDPDDSEEQCAEDQVVGPTSIQQAQSPVAGTYNCQDEGEICPAGQDRVYNGSGMVIGCETGCPDGQVSALSYDANGLPTAVCIDEQEEDCNEFHSQEVVIQQTNIRPGQTIIAGDCTPNEELCEEDEVLQRYTDNASGCEDECPAGTIAMVEYDATGAPYAVCTDPSDDDELCGFGAIVSLTPQQAASRNVGYTAGTVYECNTNEEICGENSVLVPYETGVYGCEDACPAGSIPVTYNDSNGAAYTICEAPGEDNCSDEQVLVPQQAQSRVEVRYECGNREDTCPASHAIVVYETGIAGCEDSCPAGSVAVIATTATGESYLICESPRPNGPQFSNYNPGGGPDDDGPNGQFSNYNPGGNNGGPNGSFSNYNPGGSTGPGVLTPAGDDEAGSFSQAGFGGGMFTREEPQYICPDEYVLYNIAGIATCVRECGPGEVPAIAEFNGEEYDVCVPARQELALIVEEFPEDILGKLIKIADEPAPKLGSDRRLIPLYAVSGAVVLALLLLGLSRKSLHRAEKREEPTIQQ